MAKCYEINGSNKKAVISLTLVLYAPNGIASLRANRRSGGGCKASAEPNDLTHSSLCTPDKRTNRSQLLVWRHS